MTANTENFFGTDSAAATWQAKASLTQNIRFASVGSLLGDDLGAEWASMLLGLGSFHHQVRLLEKRIVTVVRVPERACCSSFAALGALIDSARLSGRLNWTDAKTLKVGTNVHLRIIHTQRRGERISAAGVIESNTESSITVRLVENRQGVTRCTLTESSLTNYKLTLEAHASQWTASRRRKIWPFFKRTSGSKDDTWLMTDLPACNLVTNRTEWKRDVTGIYALLDPKGRGASKFTIEDLLLPDETGKWHFQVCSPGGLSDVPETPLTILDGARALLDIEVIGSGNLLVILDERDFQNSTPDAIARLVDARLDDSSPLESWIPSELPTGVEISTMVLGLQV